MAVGVDRLRLFSGVGPLFGSFSVLEVSIGLPGGSQLLASAGREPRKPAFVAYRLGRGIVIRTGTPLWSAELLGSGDVRVQEVTLRLWRLLGGR
jgi:hypothetical protein